MAPIRPFLTMPGPVHESQVTINSLEIDPEDNGERAPCKYARKEILRLFSDATLMELKIRELDDEDEEEREEKEGLQVGLLAKVEALSRFTEVRYTKISRFQPLIDGPAVVDYGEELIRWFKSGMQRACINARKLKKKIPPQHLSKRTYRETQGTDETVRLQCQERVKKAESELRDLQWLTRKRSSYSRALEMQEELASLLKSCNTIRREIKVLKSSLRNSLPDANSMDIDIPLDDLPTVSISSLASGFAQNQVSLLLGHLLNDCREGLVASTKMLYAGVWEKLSMPLGVAAAICDTLPPESQLIQKDNATYTTNIVK